MQSDIKKTQHYNCGLVNEAVACNGHVTHLKGRSLDESLPIPKLRLKYSASVVFLAALLCFCNSYNGDFVFDDRRAILENQDLLPGTPLSNVFMNDFWGTRMTSGRSHKSYRPLTVLSFRLSYYLGGGFNRQWFHIPNILLHGIVSAQLLPVFAVLIDDTDVGVGKAKFQFRSTKSAFLCALLFAVHPIHTENVSANVGRADLSCALLFLLSFMLYVKACSIGLEHATNTAMIARPTRLSLLYLMGSVVLCFLSVLCKEQGLTVIGVCCAYDIVIVCKLDPLRLLGLRSKDSCSRGTIGESCDNVKEISKDPWLSGMMKRQIILFISGSFILVFRCNLMGNTPPFFLPDDNPHSFQNGTLIRGLNYNYLYSLHSWLLVHPWWLCCDWSMGSVPVIESLSDPRILCVVAFWTCFGMLLFKSLKTPIIKEQRHIMMAMSFIIIPFLPASNVFFRVGFVVAERALYLPSIGFCMLIVLGLRRINTIYTNTQATKLAVLTLVLIFTVRCMQRSYQWRDAMTLYKSAESVCPLNAKIVFNVGKMAEDNGDTHLAEEKYREALKLHVDYVRSLNNLGHLLAERGKSKEAEQYLSKAANIDPTDADVWLNLGRVKKNLKKYGEAERCFAMTLKYKPNNAKCYVNLGNMYLELSQFDRAVRAWTNATILNPKLASAWSNMAFQLYIHGYIDESISVSERGLKHLPNEPRLHYNLGYIYGRQGRWVDSENEFLKAIQLDPNNANYYQNLGAVFAQWQKYDLSVENYRKALERNPNQPNVKETLAKMQKRRSAF